MSNINQTLASLAESLDGVKLIKAANVVDSVNQNVLKLVKAQFEGVQGYWVRNQRCWSNCYRQKRSASNKPAQEIWQECQKEYEASLGKDESPWDKYAGALPNVIKTASTTEQNRFHKEVFAKVAQGHDYPSAVFDTIKSNLLSKESEILAESVRLSKVADYLVTNGYGDLGKKAADASLELVKLSQFNQGTWWNPMNWKGNVKDKVKQWTGGGNAQDTTVRLQRALQAVDAFRTRFPQDMTQMPANQQQQLWQGFTNLQKQVGVELNNLQMLTRNDPRAGQIYQKIMMPFHQFSNARDVKSRRLALDQLASSIGMAINQMPVSQPTNRTAPQQAAQPSVKQQPSPTPKPPAPAATPAPTQTAQPAATPAVVPPTVPPVAKPPVATQPSKAKSPGRTKLMVDYIQKNKDAINAELAKFKDFKFRIAAQKFNLKKIAQTAAAPAVADDFDINSQTPQTAARWIYDTIRTRGVGKHQLEKAGLKFVDVPNAATPAMPANPNPVTPGAGDAAFNAMDAQNGGGAATGELPPVSAPTVAPTSTPPQSAPAATPKVSPTVAPTPPVAATPASAVPPTATPKVAPASTTVVPPASNQKTDPTLESLVKKDEPVPATSPAAGIPSAPPVAATPAKVPADPAQWQNAKQMMIKVLEKLDDAIQPLDESQGGPLLDRMSQLEVEFNNAMKAGGDPTAALSKLQQGAKALNDEVKTLASSPASSPVPVATTPSPTATSAPVTPPAAAVTPTKPKDPGQAAKGLGSLLNRGRSGGSSTATTPSPAATPSAVTPAAPVASPAPAPQADVKSRLQNLAKPSGSATPTAAPSSAPSSGSSNPDIKNIRQKLQDPEATKRMQKSYPGAIEFIDAIEKGTEPPAWVMPMIDEYVSKANSNKNGDPFPRTLARLKKNYEASKGQPQMAAASSDKRRFKIASVGYQARLKAAKLKKGF